MNEVATEYFNPFPTQPLRLLWWMDDQLHKYHIRGYLACKFCDYLDHRLWDGTEDFFKET